MINKVGDQLTALKTMLDLCNFSLKEPAPDSAEKDLKAASKWLQAIIDDFKTQFDVIYSEHHTGDSFWSTAKACGLCDEDGIMSDLPICIEMRKLLLQVKRRLVKKLPVLFGGVDAKTKAKRATREEDSEGADSVSEEQGLVS